MSSGCVLFVQGTGVRLKTYQQTLAAARQRAKDAGIERPIAECEWGNALGIREPTLSLPGDPSAEQKQRAIDHEQQWSHLEDDPLFELRLLASDGAAGAPPAVRFGQESPAEALWTLITTRTRSIELDTLLRREHADAAWPAVFQRVTGDPIARRAVLAAGGDTADAAMALARALAAALVAEMRTQGVPAPPATFKDRLIDRLRVDWEQQVFALRGRVKAFVSSLLRERRRAWSERISPEIGDILLYQANGDLIRAFIRRKIEAAPPPVYLLAHSLGGIACVDLLAMKNPPAVAGLITVGSQAPLFYEMGALHGLDLDEPLPAAFPKWLNIYDQNDFLSYVGGRLFAGRVDDVEVESGELPLAAHSAYWSLDTTWQAIGKFVA